MVVIFLVAGVIYVYYTGQQQPAPAKPAAKTETNPTGLPKPQQPAANAQEGVALESFNAPVKAGENTSLQIRTNPTSTCTIVVTYNGAVSHDSGLADKKADPYGFVTWTWTIPTTVPPGTYPAKVTCFYNGRSGVAVENFVVTAG
jgi:hypothetical protein